MRHLGPVVGEVYSCRDVSLIPTILWSVGTTMHPTRQKLQ